MLEFSSVHLLSLLGHLFKAVVSYSVVTLTATSPSTLGLLVVCRSGVIVSLSCVSTLVVSSLLGVRHVLH